MRLSYSLVLFSRTVSQRVSSRKFTSLSRIKSFSAVRSLFAAVSHSFTAASLSESSVFLSAIFAVSTSISPLPPSTAFFTSSRRRRISVGFVLQRRNSRLFVVQTWFPPCFFSRRRVRYSSPHCRVPPLRRKVPLLRRRTHPEASYLAFLRLSRLRSKHGKLILENLSFLRCCGKSFGKSRTGILSET